VAAFLFPSRFPCLDMDPRDHDATRDHVLAHFESPHHRGKCAAPTHAFEAAIPSCGDEVRIELRIATEVIAEAWFTGRGCVISQASASMLVESIEGKPVEEVSTLDAEEILRIFRMPLSPNRQRCCLLAWRVLRSALSSPLP